VAKSNKVKWRGKFVFKSETHILYSYAVSEKKAWVNMCKRLSELHGTRVDEVMSIFDGSQDNFTIGREV